MIKKHVSFKEAITAFEDEKKIELFRLEYGEFQFVKSFKIHPNDTIGSIKDINISLYDIFYGIWYIVDED